MRTLTKSRDRMLFGVAGGMAEYFDMDKSIWRLIWVLVCIPMPPAILAYLILGIVLPNPVPAAQETIDVDPPGPSDTFGPGAGPQANQANHGSYQANQGGYQAPRNYKRMTKSRDKWLSGVAAGIAEYLDLDPILIRAAFLIAFFVFGTGLLAYIILAIIMPQPDRIAG